MCHNEFIGKIMLRTLMLLILMLIMFDMKAHGINDCPWEDFMLKRVSEISDKSKISSNDTRILIEPFLRQYNDLNLHCKIKNDQLKKASTKVLSENRNQTFRYLYNFCSENEFPDHTISLESQANISNTINSSKLALESLGIPLEKCSTSASTTILVDFNKLTKDIKDEAALYIEPFNIYVAAGTSLRNNLENYCGQLSQVYLIALREHISDPTTLDEVQTSGQYFEVPFCFGRKEFHQARKNSKQTHTVLFKPGFNLTYLQAFLNSPQNKDNEESSLPSFGFHIHDISDSELRLRYNEDCGISQSDFKVPQPYDRNKVFEVINNNNIIRSHTTYTPSSTSGILVADTGILGYDKAPFDKEFIITNNRVNSSERVEQLKANKSYILQNKPLYKHGTYVTSLSLGGPQFYSINKDFKLIRVAVEKIFNPISSNREERFKPAVEKLNDIAERAEDNGEISIVNLSLSFDDSLENFDLNHLNRLSHVLYVVAAGNSGTQRSLDNPLLSSYPANYGGSSVRDNIIVVGALDWEGHLAEFSKYSKKYVEIAAPGCMVIVNDYDEKSEKHTTTLKHGTSIAAPLVSFTAALINKEVAGLYPYEIKRRILYSADISEDTFNYKLSEYVSNGRILNIEKAISIFVDQVELVDGEILTGKVTFKDGENFVEFCDTPLYPEMIQKVAKIDETRFLIDWEIKHHEKNIQRMEPLICENLDEKEILLEKITSISGNGIQTEIMNIQLNNIKDIVFALRPYWN